MQPLARAGDKFAGPGQPLGSIAGPGATSVFIGGLPALRAGDTCRASTAAVPGTVLVAEGAATVLIEGKPAARHGDLTSNGAKLIANQSNVVTG